METLPSKKQCLSYLHESGCSEEVIAHCLAVRDLAVRIAKKAHADIKLVEVGALLHDIGRAKTHGITHGIEGVEIAKTLKLPEKVKNIIERHLGAGIPKDEAIQLGLPPKNYIPITLEEKIVAHADNLIEDGEKQTINAEIKKVLEKGQKQYANRLLQLHNELSHICGVNLDQL